MNDNTAIQLRYQPDQDMQYEESTIDDSSIQQTPYSTPSSDWNLQQQNSYSSPSSYAKSHGKGSKKVKSEDDEDIDIDSYVQTDVQRIPVKTLRKIIPKLRIAVYCSDLMTSGKRKLKHLWDERPVDWPHNIPFKDPNNACKDVKKPGKDELSPMFNFLKQKYIQTQSGHHQQTTAAFNNDGEYKFSQQVMTESSSDKDAAFYSSISSNPILPQIPYEQQTVDHASSFMISPKPEPSPYVDISELMGNGQQLVSITPQGSVVSVNIVKPQPVMELFSRLDKKNSEVINLCPVENQGIVAEILRKVQQGVIKKLFDEITPSDTRICLMFLDAGHQMEALLDVMLVLKHVDLQLLDNGCQEIIKKFDTRNVGFVFHPQVVPQLNGKNQLLQRSSVPSSFKMDSCSDMSDDNLFYSKTSDDMIRDLGLDLFENRKGKVGDVLENAKDVPNNVQLFRPRHGTGGCVLEDNGLGIQTRPLPEASLSSGDGKSSFAPVKGMVVVEKKDGRVGEMSQRNVMSPQQHVEEIMKHLKDGSPLSPLSHFLSMNNSSPIKEYSNELLASDLDDISDIIMYEQSTEDQSSVELQVNNTCLPSFCQESGSGFGDQHSQLLPSSASSMIPSMVESAICADSETEDSDNSSSFMDFGGYTGNGGGQQDRGFLVSYYDPFKQWQLNG